jgi:hypothetical protein
MRAAGRGFTGEDEGMSDNYRRLVSNLRTEKSKDDEITRLRKLVEYYAHALHVISGSDSYDIAIAASKSALGDDPESGQAQYLETYQENRKLRKLVAAKDEVLRRVFESDGKGLEYSDGLPKPTSRVPIWIRTLARDALELQ